MNILGIDCSLASRTAVGVMTSGGKLFDTSVADDGSSEERLMDRVGAALAEAGLNIRDIDLIAAGVGPGSFTGIRIGISAARALAWAAEKPLVGISSLELLSLSAEPRTEYVCAMTDARMKRVFAAVFHNGERITEDMDIEPGVLADKLSAFPPESLSIAGDGLVKYSGFFEGMTRLPATVISALAICEAGRKFYVPGGGDYRGVVPVYLRKSEAELQWELRQK
ncbi:MAG: tRNA (adenosine(37)-N6)-threonylcarbamoyltransferase complex dimerization subunit type 1 TsaB [Spirochaetes bacterium GWF1_51_8]|nr:MAG: tRNA (adenosine(37)-N6)-threonylcarbamoyltransferase complex dimerization subunit type 1 TsaB [Spirochaetes bacterium GWF1_51_8]